MIGLEMRSHAEYLRIERLGQVFANVVPRQSEWIRRKAWLDAYLDA